MIALGVGSLRDANRGRAALTADPMTQEESAPMRDKPIASPLAGKTHREVVLGPRGGIHIAHPLADEALCGAAIAERPGIDAFSGGEMRDGVYVCGVNACRECTGATFGGGNESRAVSAYA